MKVKPNLISQFGTDFFGMLSLATLSQGQPLRNFEQLKAKEMRAQATKSQLISKYIKEHLSNVLATYIDSGEYMDWYTKVKTFFFISGELG